MGLLAWIIIGLIAGWLTGLILRGSGYGIIGDIVIGIIGGLLGGFLVALLSGVADLMSEPSIGTILGAFVGSVLLVSLIRALPGRTRT